MTIKLLFDMGASVSIISPTHLELLKKAGKIKHKVDCRPKMYDASGQIMACQGVFELQFFFKGNPISGHFVVSQSLSGPPILGMNVMAKGDGHFTRLVLSLTF